MTDYTKRAERDALVRHYIPFDDQGSTHWDGCEQEHWKCALVHLRRACDTLGLAPRLGCGTRWRRCGPRSKGCGRRSRILESKGLRSWNWTCADSGQPEMCRSVGRCAEVQTVERAAWKDTRRKASKPVAPDASPSLPGSYGAGIKPGHARRCTQVA